MLAEPIPILLGAFVLPVALEPCSDDQIQQRNDDQHNDFLEGYMHDVFASARVSTVDAGAVSGSTPSAFAMTSTACW